MARLTRALILGLACMGLTAHVAAAETLNVVTSFSILGDMTQRIGGVRVQVHTLVGYDADAHMYQPTPADAKTIARANVVVVNGFGFEGWINRLVNASGYRGQVLVAGQGIKTLTRAPSKNDRDAEVDPHAWQDVSNALQYVDNITQALSEADPSGNAFYQARAEKYRQEIAALDREIRKTFNAIPAGRRRVVTTHDAFAYFSRAYGVNFISPLGIKTDVEPSAGDIGRIIQQIRREQIPAVFMENISDPRLLDRIQKESGARIGGTLYSDSLSTVTGPAHTYLDMMRHNAKTLSEAMLR